ncbi:MAG: photosynthetic complex assembly protein PuhC [Rhodocyclaceae bacterium]|nr:photosynthetic complex assembly protein PuhC [Rhodocyclaceae bacterium]
MPGWLMAAVVVMPAIGFWLGLELRAQGTGSVAATAAAPPAPLAAPATLRTVGMRHLRFVDAPDKSVQVLDADTGAEVYRVVGEAGFVRGILRGMARERKRLGKGPGEPFELSLNAGLLTLRDLATGQRIELTAFGHTNAGAFARMLVDVQPVPEAGDRQ